MPTNSAAMETHVDEQGTFSVAPKSSPHLQTFIMLHPGGDQGRNFGQLLLHQAPGGGEGDENQGFSLRDAFPHARFVFPSAPVRKVPQVPAWLPRWFNWWSLKDAEAREEVQAEGLRQSIATVRALVGAEKAKLADSKGGSVVLMGLSNGAATALASLVLLGDYRDRHQQFLLPVDAVVAMCGWLPYARKLLRKADDADGEVRDEVVRWLAREIGWPDGDEVAPSARKPLTPVFVGHGDADEVVPLERMSDAQEGLRALGFGVDSKVYPGLGHWYSEKMLEDIVEWLRPKLADVDASNISAEG